MPQPYQSSTSEGGSPSGLQRHTSTPDPSQLTESQPPERRDSAPEQANSASKRPNSPEFGSTGGSAREAGSSGESSAALAESWFSLDATEPFPDALWRMPVPNRVFDRRPELSEAAFRVALAVCHLAARFVPAAQASPGDARHWTIPERTFTRRDVDEAAGLSDTATRAALKELEAIGWVSVCTEGRAHRYAWLLDVPTERFTQVPTRLLERLPDLPTGTAFDVLWQVLRATWGWTSPAPEGQSGPRVHRRWAPLSVGQLAAACGRSNKSVRQAIRRLNGQWIERARPGETGAAQFRVLPEALHEAPQEASQEAPHEALEEPPREGASSPLSGRAANEIPPDRQRNSPPLKETSSKENNHPRRRRSDACSSGPTASKHVVSSNSNSKGARHRSEPALKELSETKRAAYRYFADEGMWPGRALRAATRYSAERLRRNAAYFERERRKQPIVSPGAWLYRAITDDFAFQDAERQQKAAEAPELRHKGRYSPEEMQALVGAGAPPEAFHKAAGGPEGKPWMYFDPGKDGPAPSRAQANLTG